MTGLMELLAVIRSKFLILTVWALIGANSVGWESATTVVKLAAGVALIVAFVFAERLHPRPMFDLALSCI